MSKNKSLGRKHGFEHAKQGNLFFDVARIIKAKIPPAFMLENVKNLVSHDKGNTFAVITETLKELGYKIGYKVIDGKYYVPQHRERTYIVGFDRKIVPEDFEFNFPDPADTVSPGKMPALKSVLDTGVDIKYTLTDRLWAYLKKYAEKHKAKGNGFGFGIADPDGYTRTLSARYYKDGSEILIAQANKNPRRLTPPECARLMGFPETFKIPVSDMQAYRQFGNSVIVPVVYEVAKRMVAVLNKHHGQAIKRKKKLEHVPDKGKEYQSGVKGQTALVLEGY